MDINSILVTKCNLEREIMEKIKSDNGATCHFSYSPIHDYVTDTQKVRLSLLTSKNNEIFIAHTTQVYSTEVECLNEVIQYLNEIKKENSGYLTYEVVWSKGSTEKNKSFFYGKYLTEVIDKFYKGKENTRKDYIIYSVILQPES